MSSLRGMNTIMTDELAILDKTRLTEWLQAAEWKPERWAEREALFNTLKQPFAIVRCDADGPFTVDAGWVDVPMGLCLIQDGAVAETVPMRVKRLLRVNDLNDVERTPEFLKAWQLHWSRFYAMAVDPMADAKQFPMFASEVLLQSEPKAQEEMMNAIEFEHHKRDGRLRPLT